MLRDAKTRGHAYLKCGIRCAVAILVLVTVACAPERTAIDPAQCRSIIVQGGTSSAYTGCLLDRAKDKSVGGIPVLSERARSALNDRDNDPCLSVGDTTPTDLLACEIGRPPRPAPAAEPQARLPLVVVPGW